MPQLRTVAGFCQQKPNYVVRREPTPLQPPSESRLSQVSREHTSVVSIALNLTGVAWDPVFAKPLVALHDGARKVEAGNRRALPERRLGRNPALSKGGDPEPGKIAQRRDEACRRDDVVDLELEGTPVCGASSLDCVSGSGALHALDRCVEDHDAAAERPVLVRLHITRAHADERARFNRKPRAARRGKYDLPRPGQEARRDLEA